MKHAYLIEAHKDDLTFETLLSLIDDNRNDIYIHMDKKNNNFDKNKYIEKIKRSNIFIIDRINVNWGSYSQIEAELMLIEAAVNNSTHYSYLHLLSGEDLPIKSQNYIHDFFNHNDGKEFIRFENSKFKYDSRVKYFHTFQSWIPRNNIMLNKINNVYLKIQKFCRVNRNNTVEFQKGTNWFSITENLAEYVLSKKEWIRKTFRSSYCADEIFLQTIVHNSSFKEKLYKAEYNNDLEAIMRIIDWERGTPYIFDINDIEEIVNSKMLFARKFNEKKDSQIIRKIAEIYNM